MLCAGSIAHQTFYGKKTDEMKRKKRQSAFLPPSPLKRPRPDYHYPKLTNIDDFSDYDAEEQNTSDNRANANSSSQIGLLASFVNPAAGMSGDEMVEYLSRVSSIQLVNRLVDTARETDQLCEELKGKASDMEKIIKANEEKVHTVMMSTKTDLAAAEAQHNETTRVRNALEKKRRELEDSLQRERARLAELITEAEAQARKLAEATDRGYSLARSLVTKTEQYEELLQEKNALLAKQAISSSEARSKTTLEEEIRRLQASLSGKDDLLSRLRHQYSHTSSPIDIKPRIDNTSLEIKIEQLIKENKQVTKEKEGLEDQLQTSQDAAIAERRELQDKNRELEDKNRELQRVTLSLERRLSRQSGHFGGCEYTSAWRSHKMTLLAIPKCSSES